MNTPNTSTHTVIPRLRRLLQRPLREKVQSLRNRWNLFVSSVPLLTLLPSGLWWLKRNDNLSEPLLSGSFETAELAFVEKFLQPGMTVLDIGAHNGLYSLLASQRVGFSGRVFSFEPSPRERRALRLNLALNLSWNVAVQAFALGSEETIADLFVVQGTQTGCNSLRPPDVFSSTKSVRVRVTTLDQWLQRKGISRVDFIKLDVEGAELDVLKGAVALLQNRPRPVILAEVQDVRCAPWGYKAKDVLNLLEAAGFTWFCFSTNGPLEKLDMSRQLFEGNYVACPSESLQLLPVVRQ